MDAASRDAAALLRGLQEAREHLGAVWSHFTRRGARPGRPYLVLSGRPFTVHESGGARQFEGSVALGVLVRGADDREYQLGIDLLWDERGWAVTTEAWVEQPEGGQTRLRALPERTASTLHECLAHLEAAVEDLLRFEDLVPIRG